MTVELSTHNIPKCSCTRVHVFTKVTFM